MHKCGCACVCSSLSILSAYLDSQRTILASQLSISTLLRKGLFCSVQPTLAGLKASRFFCLWSPHTFYFCFYSFSLPFNLRFKLRLTTVFYKMKKINGLCKIFLMKFSLQSLILIQSPQQRTLMEKSNLISSVSIKLSDPSLQPVSSFLLLITLRWLESLVYSKQF